MTTTITLGLITGTIALLSFFLSPRAKSTSAFFHGKVDDTHPPSLLTLTLSQVTTWIFARSLMNAAILGFYYGIWGTLAYAAYYLSFLTGAAIISSLRFRHGFNSVQDFLADRFGAIGNHCYNFVIGLRLVSEIFANLLVIGILFGTTASSSYLVSILAFAAITLLYSINGGLHASLRTDVMQMVIFLVVLSVLLLQVITGDNFAWDILSNTPFVITDPGPILLMVAFMQVGSYPMHDPVMMDRGFLADKRTTLHSFYHATWISIVCIVGFGLLGIFAGANALSGESMNDALTRLTSPAVMMMFAVTLVISAMSTLDSTLSSAAKLMVVDMKLMGKTLANGRIVMAVFMVCGLLLVFLDNKDLFSAVAVSGTASMYLAPVILFSLWEGKQNIAQWSYVCSFVLAVGGATLYFLESSGYTTLLGDAHKYTKLLYICLVVLIGGCLAFWLGLKANSDSSQQAATH